MNNISVLVLTKNEEQDLPGCLDSISWSNDIHVYDSYSTDRTVEIARSFGAKVTQREFDNWAAHQNWGLQNIDFKNDWVFYIDADERMTEELKNCILLAIQQKENFIAYKVQRRDFYMATWLKHVQTTSLYIRLFQPSKMRYERLVNPVSIPLGPVGQVKGFLDHFPFSKGIDHWIGRHNSYSKLEAQQIIARTSNTDYKISDAIFSKDFHQRRFVQKEIFYRLPFRPLIKFLILYFFKRGFLDGKAGLSYALLQAIYEYFIVLKTAEYKKTLGKTHQPR